MISTFDQPLLQEAPEVILAIREGLAIRDGIRSAESESSRVSVQTHAVVVFEGRKEKPQTRPAPKFSGNLGPRGLGKYPHSRASKALDLVNSDLRLSSHQKYVFSLGDGSLMQISSRSLMKSGLGAKASMDFSTKSRFRR